jgi:hypothetical protein
MRAYLIGGQEGGKVIIIDGAVSFLNFIPDSARQKFNGQQINHKIKDTFKEITYKLDKVFGNTAWYCFVGT